MCVCMNIHWNGYQARPERPFLAALLTIYYAKHAHVRVTFSFVSGHAGFGQIILQHVSLSSTREKLNRRAMPTLVSSQINVQLKQP